MKKKIIAYLRGGIGNQLFQYATARALALDNDSELVLDNWSGFIRDKIYKRKFELNELKIQARLASKFEILYFLFYRLINRILKTKPKFKKNFLKAQILTETNDAKYYLSELNNINLNTFNWLDGHWQSPKYFEHYKQLLQKELMPPKPISEKFLKVGEKMIVEESVAIGIRLYEEEPKEILVKNSKIKKSFEINNAINKIKKKISNVNFYLFCTKNDKFLEELELPKNTMKITAENGFEDAVNTLWLLSRCKHHVITSSTFYWWGAWLSSKIHQDNKQIIYSDELDNLDGIPKNWNRF